MHRLSSERVGAQVSLISNELFKTWSAARRKVLTSTAFFLLCFHFLSIHIYPKTRQLTISILMSQIFQRKVPFEIVALLILCKSASSVLSFHLSIRTNLWKINSLFNQILQFESAWYLNIAYFSSLIQSGSIIRACALQNLIVFFSCFYYNWHITTKIQFWITANLHI